jgi:hypothetical protein
MSVWSGIKESGPECTTTIGAGTIEIAESSFQASNAAIGATTSKRFTKPRDRPKAKFAKAITDATTPLPNPDMSEDDIKIWETAVIMRLGVMPLFLFSVLFGLSMDYQVFLLSRIRERYDERGDTTDAVTFGVASTARIITGAALIIVAVFAGFARGDLIMFQQMGFGVAVALLIDATVIRSVVLPSAMKLLGGWNWYVPSWLEWLPRVRLEARSQS